MADKDRPADKRLLSGLARQDAAAWKEAWARARSKEEQSEAWIRERIGRASRPGPQEGPRKTDGPEPDQ